MSDVVITWLLNSVADPQRGTTHLPADSGLLAELRTSVARHDRHLVVLHDCLPDRDGGNTTFVRVGPGGNPYFYRWALTAAYLDAHPEIDRVWCVDGTDTEMLNDPFPHMQRGRLYVGSEPGTINDASVGPWLHEHCRKVSPWLADNGTRIIVNPGTVGGDLATVTRLARALADNGDDWEMGLFQKVVYEDFPDHITGEGTVHTKFKYDQRTSPAWWRHK